MPNFLLTYSGGGAGMPETPEAQAEVMAAWTAWFADLGETVVDGGAPTAESGQVAADGAVATPATTGITGYSILPAGALDGAMTLAKGCPILAEGGTVSVHATVSMG